MSPTSSAPSTDWRSASTSGVCRSTSRSSVTSWCNGSVGTWGRRGSPTAASRSKPTITCGLASRATTSSTSSCTGSRSSCAGSAAALRSRVDACSMGGWGRGCLEPPGQGRLIPTLSYALEGKQSSAPVGVASRNVEIAGVELGVAAHHHGPVAVDAELCDEPGTRRKGHGDLEDELSQRSLVRSGNPVADVRPAPVLDDVDASGPDQGEKGVERDPARGHQVRCVVDDQVELP